MKSKTRKPKRVVIEVYDSSVSELATAVAQRVVAIISVVTALALLAYFVLTLAISHCGLL